MMPSPNKLIHRPNRLHIVAMGQTVNYPRRVISGYPENQFMDGHMAETSEDALSDILRLIRLKGCVYFQSDFSSPWGMDMGAGSFAQFHLVVRGQCWLIMDGLRHRLAAGDIVVLPHGDAHTLVDEPSTQPRAGPDVLMDIQSGRQPFPEGELSTRLLCGHFEFDRNLNHPLIRDLPKRIHLKGMHLGQPNWLEAITPILIGETGAGQPGGETVSERLAEVLLIQVLRTHLLTQAEDAGFLAAIGDQRINRALKVIHLGAGDTLTLSDVAREVGMSRSGLAVRFRELVGDTPMNYLTNWRMLKARDMLVSGSLSLAEVAEQVGYSSEAAFSRAFKREFDQNPSAYRRLANRRQTVKVAS